MPKTKTLQSNTCVGAGVSRIEAIKSTISTLKPEPCKAEVYETWENIFEPDENDQ